MMKLDIQLFADGKVVINTELNTKDFENGLDRMQNTSKKAGSTIKNIVAGLGIAKIISKGLNTITSSIDDAVKRVDTLNNFPKVMKNLGISAEESSKSINKMSDKLAGLPTTLDQGASAVQRFTSKNGDVKKSTDIFLALNNAILAGGAPTEQQATALEQLSQSYAKGKPDMMEWRSAMSAMPAQLKQVAQAMGYVNADELGEALRNGTVSMDEFMDKVVELNKKGVNGFQSFEKQARNSTSGISTAVTVAKTQVTKGVADIINGIDKGLKKSGTSISKIFADIGKETKKALDKVATALSKVDFNKVFKTIKSLIPVVETLTASFIAYNLAIKGMQLFNFVKDLTSATKVFLGLVPAIQSATVSQTALNMAMSVSPIGLATAGIAGLVAGLVILSTRTDEYTKKANEQTKANNEIIKSQQEMNKEMQKRIDSGSSEMQYYKNLQTELSGIVDENGKIKEGYEDRAKVITGILKDALGIEANIVDGVIKNYKEYNNQIDKTIAKKKAKILLDAQEEQYTEAIKNQLKYQKQIAKASEEIEKWTKKINDAKKERATLDPIADKEEYQRLTDNIIQYQGYLDAKQKQYDSGKKIVDEYATDIALYESNLANFQKEKYDEMIQDMDGYVARLSENNNKKKEAIENDIKTEESTLERLKELKKKSHSDMYDEQIKAHEQTLEQYKKELSDLNTKIETDRNTWLVGTQKTLSDLSGQQIKFKDLGNGFVQAYVNGSKSGQPVAYNNLDDFAKNIQGKLSKNTDISSEEAKKLIKKYSTKLSDSDSKSKAKKSAEEIGKSQLEGIKSKNKDFENAGASTVDGVVRGSNSAQSLNKAYNAGKKIAQKEAQGYKDYNQIHSPSRLYAKLSAFIPKGIAVGIDKNSDIAVKSIKSMSKNLYNEMQNSVDLETSKITASVQTSGTYQMAMAGNPTINLNDTSTNKTQLVVNGRVLAEVVNTENRNREVAKA